MGKYSNSCFLVSSLQMTWRVISIIVLTLLTRHQDHDSFMKTIIKPDNYLFFILLGASLLLAACSGTPAPATPVPTTDAAAATSQDNALLPRAASTANPTSAIEQVIPTRKPASTYADLEVITLLPPDAIPAIDNPQFLSVDEANAFYDPDELVLGVSFNGDSRAYSAPFLSGHEIVNDTVGGVKLAVTW